MERAMTGPATMDLDTNEAPAREPDMASRRGGALRRIKAVAVVFALTTACLTVAAYQYGDGHVWIGDRTISDMNVLEVTGASAASVTGLVVGLGAAAIALVAALIATVVSLAVAVLVGGLGVFFAIGVATGPILLAIIVGVLIKRRYYPDVI